MKTPEQLFALKIDATILCFRTNGALAQLGEHHLRKVGVVGSNPMRSMFSFFLRHSTLLFGSQPIHLKILPFIAQFC